MKLTAIELNGFRGFARAQEFDLDADAVILSGPNGQGKTSLLDGVLWALTGKIPRLGSDDRRLLSLYSETDAFRVSLQLRTTEGRPFRIVRSFDGAQQQLSIEIAGESFHEESATSRLLEALWPTALFTQDAITAFTSAITRSVYLQQDLVRQFIEADTEQDRFAAVSELVGAGRVTELQVQLDRARTAWTRAINERLKEAETTRQRRDDLQAQRDRLSEAERESLGIDIGWNAWWDRARTLGVHKSHVPPAASIQGALAFDHAIKQLQALKLANDRRLDLASTLLSQIRNRPAIVLPEEGPLSDRVAAYEQTVKAVRISLTEAEAKAVQDRRVQVELRETRQELKTLAQLALRHLGERCPVCTQTYDEAHTRRHLMELADAAEGAEIPSTTDEVLRLARVLEEEERALSAAQVELRRAEQTIRDNNTWMA